MSEIGHKVRETLTLANRTNSAFGAMGTSPANRILGSELDGSSEYILIARCGLGGSDNQANTFEAQIEEASVGTLAESNCRFEPRSTINQNGIHYGFLDKVTTAATPNNYEIQAKSDGTDTVRVNGSWLAMLKLDDLDAADWAYAANDTDDTTLTTTFEDGASINLSPGDWDIYAFARFDDNSTSAYFLARMDVDGTVKAEIRQQGEDTTSRRCLLMKTTVNIPSGTPAAKVQYALASGTSHDLLSTRIFAIRLDAFEDHAFKNKAKGVDETGVQPDDTRINVDTLTYTSDTAATRTWFICAGFTHDVASNQVRQQSAIQNTSNVDFIGDIGTASSNIPEAVCAGSGDENPTIIFGELTGHADATDLDLELDVRDNDNPGNGQIDESSISAFTWELAAVITASGTPSIPAVTASGNATVHRAASGTPSITPVTAAGTATVHRAASGTPSITPVSASGSATVHRAASGAVTLAAILAAGTAAVVHTGSGTPSIAPVEAAGTAIVRKQASGNPSIPTIEASGTALVHRAASGTPSITAITAAGTATVHRAASGTPSIAAVTAAGTATVISGGNITASGDGPVPAVTASGTALVHRAASGSPSIPGIVAAGTATVHRAASGTPSITAIVAAGTATVHRAASGTPSIPSIVAAGTAKVHRAASGTPSIAAIVAAGTASVVKTASGDGPVPAVVAAGTGLVHRAASGSPSIAAITASGTASVHRSASGSSSIPAIIAAGLAKVHRIASGNPSIAAVTASGNAIVGGIVILSSTALEGRKITVELIGRTIDNTATGKLK